jgi:hypothetical protein
MSYKHIGTAGDLVRFGCSLRVECTFCHAARTLTAVQVVQVHGNASLATLRKRLKCSRCGEKAARFVVLPPV